LPIFLCWGRLWAELGANQAAWKYNMQHLNWTEAIVMDQARYKADQLSSAAYLWAWPRSWARAAYKKVADEVIDDWKKQPSDLG
jgi:hypothetical protein